MSEPGDTLRTDARISCVIATRNRREALADALHSLRAQRGVQLEVTVFDDASEDDTASHVAAWFPEVVVQRCELRQERLVLRNRGMRDASSSLVLVLDDDCYLTDVDAIADAIEHFRDPEVAVVCLPVVEPFRPRSATGAGAIAEAGADLGGFMAGASIFRKEPFLAVGGYRESLVHHHEERDLAVRLLDRGFRFVYAGGRALVHTVHPRRDVDAELRGYLRNMVLIPFLNYPFPFGLLHMLSGTARVLTVAFPNRPWGARLRGVLAGWRACLVHWRERRSVSYAAYFRHRRLPAHRPERFEGVVPKPAGRADA